MAERESLFSGRIRVVQFVSGCEAAPHVYRLHRAVGRFAVCFGRTQVRFGRPR